MHVVQYESPRDPTEAHIKSLGGIPGIEGTGELKIRYGRCDGASRARCIQEFVASGDYDSAIFNATSAFHAIIYKHNTPVDLLYAISIVSNNSRHCSNANTLTDECIHWLNLAELEHENKAGESQTLKDTRKGLKTLIISCLVSEAGGSTRASTDWFNLWNNLFPENIRLMAELERGDHGVKLKKARSFRLMSAGSLHTPRHPRTHTLTSQMNRTHTHTHHSRS